MDLNRGKGEDAKFFFQCSRPLTDFFRHEEIPPDLFLLSTSNFPSPKNSRDAGTNTKKSPRDLLLLLDSGAQYLDGTTDVTRTVGQHIDLVKNGRTTHVRTCVNRHVGGRIISPTFIRPSAAKKTHPSPRPASRPKTKHKKVHFGTPSPEEKEAFTLVLQGHIALARAIFPEGTMGASVGV